MTGVAGETYIKVRVEDALLSLPGATLGAGSFEFESDGTEILVTGEDLLFELKAGGTRIVKVTVDAFGLLFTEAGAVAAIRNATVEGPALTGFELTGTVSLDINTTGAEYTFNEGTPQAITVPTGPAGADYVRVEVTAATLVIPGATLTAASFEFEQSGDTVTVTGEDLSFELKAGSTRIVKVEVEAFGFAFTDAGMVAAIRNGTIFGPDITGFTLEGTVSLDINTTGEEYIFNEGEANELIVPTGVGGANYVRVEVTDALLIIPGPRWRRPRWRIVIMRRSRCWRC